MINSVFLSWNLTTDPELKELSWWTKILNFTIATNRKYKKGEELVDEATFHKCISFWNQAEFISTHFKKGDVIIVEGRHQTKEWEDQEGNKKQKTEVVVNKVLFNGLNKAVILWNLTADPELKELSWWTKILNFTIATNRKYKKGEEWIDEATFHKCVVFWNPTEVIATHFKKGQSIAVVWRTQIREWEDKEGNKRLTTEIVVEEFSFTGNK